MYNQLLKKGNNAIKEMKGYYQKHIKDYFSTQSFNVGDSIDFMSQELLKDKNEKSFPLLTGTQIQDVFCHFVEREQEMFKLFNNMSLVRDTNNSIHEFYIMPIGLNDFAYTSEKMFIFNLFHILDLQNLTLNDDLTLSLNSNQQDINVLNGDIQKLINFNLDDYFNECIEFYTNLHLFIEVNLDIFKHYLAEASEQIKEQNHQTKKNKQFNKDKCIYEAINQYISQINPSNVDDYDDLLKTCMDIAKEYAKKVGQDND